MAESMPQHDLRPEMFKALVDGYLAQVDSEPVRHRENLPLG